jgi:hypothetical protein
LALIIALWILYRSLPGALLFFRPSWMRQKPEPDEDHPERDDPQPIAALGAGLTKLGFSRLGVRKEKPPLGAATVSFDFVNPSEKTYASAYHLGGKKTRLYFFTPYDGGAAVLTADHSRPGSAKDGYYLAGGLNGATPEQLWAAHKRQMAAMDETGRERVAQNTLADRITTALAWFDGAGSREVRVRNSMSLFMASVAAFAIYVSVSVLSHTPVDTLLHR